MAEETKFVSNVIFDMILNELAVMSGRDWDKGWIELYGRRCEGITTQAQAKQIVDILRADYDFRPIPREFRTIVETVVGIMRPKRSEVDDLGPAQRAAYAAYDPNSLVDESHQIEGKPPMTYKQGVAMLRERAKQLSNRFDMDKLDHKRSQTYGTATNTEPRKDEPNDAFGESEY